MMNPADLALLDVLERSHARSRDALEMLRPRDPDRRWLNLCDRVDVGEALAGLSREKKLGAAAEADAELQRRHPSSGPNVIRLPWQTLSNRYAATRTAVAGTSSAGGYLVDTVNLNSAAGALLAMLTFGRLGVTHIDAGAGNVSLPLVTSPASVAWLPTESTSMTEGDPTFGQVSFTPHTVGGYVQISRLLLKQSSPQATAVIGRELARKVARFIESAALTGSGTNGAPLGLTNLGGTNSVSGSSFAISTAAAAVAATGDAYTPETGGGWVAARTVAQALRSRAEISGSSLTVWQGALAAGSLGGDPALSTSAVPSATAIFGSWNYATLVDWGGGLDVSLNPFTGFSSGIVGIRCLATVDFGVTWPSAFSIVSSIS